jgi:hypothetical protein
LFWLSDAVDWPMKQEVRVIIPVWGDAYGRKLVSVTIPALLAEGNLPNLCETFRVEIVVVTETRLFDAISGSRAYQIAANLCAARLIAIDDLLTDDPNDYGAVLTYAFFRGFSDLGARMTEVYLLPLNADFILSDGSLRSLGSLILQGKRVIHAPSFRVVLEDVWPQLEAMVEPASGRLQLLARKMVKMALANKHPTVKARTVNQRLCHQSWMDQYYWYVDENTLIGYQWPVALVAIMPERVVTSPALVWDYGFVPEAAPTAERYFIEDSDDFFMIEPQSRESGGDLIELGWISFDEIASNLSIWTTKEQRECGRQLLKIHADDLPDDLDEMIQESRAYMAEIERRLSPSPVPHRGHSYLSPWFEGTKERMQGRQRQQAEQIQAPFLAEIPKNTGSVAGIIRRGLEALYRITFGLPPRVGKFHPLWADMSPIAQKILQWRSAGESKILWVGSRDSVLRRLLDRRIHPTTVLVSKPNDALSRAAPYDACICELTLQELSKLDQLYMKIRPLVKDGGHVIVNISKWEDIFDSGATVLQNTVYPSLDISELRFFGTTTTGFLRLLYTQLSRRLSKHAIVRAMLGSVTLLLMAPIVRLANACAARRDAAIFPAMWTSLMIEFTIKRAARLQVSDTDSEFAIKGGH